MTKTFLIIIVCLVQLQLTGQEVKKKSSLLQHFSSQVAAGITEGQYGTSFQIHSINGFRVNQWYGGLGTGIDEYYFRSVPVYFSVARYLSSSSNSFFVQGDGGMNFVWEKNNIRPAWNEIGSEFKPGLYWNGSFGFSTALGKRQANNLLFSLGYAYKYIKQKTETQVFCINPPCEPLEQDYSYHLRRIAFKIGWQFNNSH
ncbi:MAG: hypothetical protein ACM3H8_07930 [Sphingobacteriales bacterium]